MPLLGGSSGGIEHDVSEELELVEEAVAVGATEVVAIVTSGSEPKATERKMSF